MIRFVQEIASIIFVKERTYTKHNLSRHIYRKPWTRALMWTIHRHDSFQNNKGENAKVLPTIATSTQYRVAKTHRIPYLYRLFSAEVTYI